VRGQSAQGLSWFIPEVGVGICVICALTCLVCRMSCRQAWSQWWQLWCWWQPSSFLSVMCCGEALHRLGTQGVKCLILVGALFLLSMTPTSQRVFGVKAQAICFCTIVTLLDISPVCFLNYNFLAVKVPCVLSVDHPER
jgi:hypothetical protein